MGPQSLEAFFEDRLFRPGLSGQPVQLPEHPLTLLLRLAPRFLQRVQTGHELRILFVVEVEHLPGLYQLVRVEQTLHLGGGHVARERDLVTGLSCGDFPGVDDGIV